MIGWCVRLPVVSRDCLCALMLPIDPIPIDDYHSIDKRAGGA